MTLNCIVVDAGARYGLHPTWADLRDVAEFHLFEMDAPEADRLARKYAASPSIKVYPIALYSSDTTLRFSVSEHQALNSVMESNQALLRQNEYMLREFTVNEQRTVQARSLDSVFEGRAVHFFKLDVEGAEMELLKGARKLLGTTVLGIRSEVLFAEIYVGAPLFGDLNRFLLDEGFELLNFDYTGAGNKAGRFTLPNKYGKLLSTDAVWVVGADRLFAATGDRLAQDVIRMALFFLNNGATDLAVDTLTRAVTRENVSFGPYEQHPLFRALHRKALLLFKALLGVPQLLESDILSTYKTIFGADFPIMNQFYESDLFS